MLNLCETSGSHQHTWGGDFRASGKRVHGQPGTRLSFGGPEWTLAWGADKPCQLALGLKEDREHLGSLIPFILINMTTADTTLLSTHNTQKRGLSSFQGDKSGEWGFPNGGRGVWGLLTSGAGVTEPHSLVAMVSHFPIIQDSCPVPI